MNVGMKEGRKDEWKDGRERMKLGWKDSRKKESKQGNTRIPTKGESEGGK